jgi:plasmid stability protein
MKTTIDLPEPLVRAMKLRAAQEGRKLKDVATEIFRLGLNAPSQSVDEKPLRQKLVAPLFICEPSQASASGMKIDQLLRLEQQAQMEEDLNRVSSSL